MLKRKRERQVRASETGGASASAMGMGGASASAMGMGGASATGTGTGTGGFGESETASASTSIIWCPRDTAFSMQRLIIQRYFFGETEDRCTICLEDLEQRMATHLPCKHAFHYTCWHKMVEQRTYTCPLCRANFSETLPAVGIETAIENDNMVVLTIFTHMDLYDFMLELLWRNYEREAEGNILAEDIFD